MCCISRGFQCLHCNANRTHSTQREWIICAVVFIFSLSYLLLPFRNWFFYSFGICLSVRCSIQTFAVYFSMSMAFYSIVVICMRFVQKPFFRDRAFDLRFVLLTLLLRLFLNRIRQTIIFVSLPCAAFATKRNSTLL